MFPNSGIALLSVYTKGLTAVNGSGITIPMTKPRTNQFARKRRMVVLPSRVDDALLKRSRQIGLSISPMIRQYVIDGLKRDRMLEAR